MWAILQSMKRLKFISRRNKQSCKVVDVEHAYSDFPNRDTKSHEQHSDGKNSKNNSQATSKINGAANLNKLHLKLGNHKYFSKSKEIFYS